MAAPIAALSNEDVENDDQYDDVSYTTSIASSITDYKFEHGRRYHAYKEGRYLLPNDEAEQDRMDLQYHALRLAFGDKMIFAPVSEKLGRVLDAGTGTGMQSWTLSNRSSSLTRFFPMAGIWAEDVGSYDSVT